MAGGLGLMMHVCGSMRDVGHVAYCIIRDQAQQAKWPQTQKVQLVNVLLQANTFPDHRPYGASALLPAADGLSCRGSHHCQKNGISLSSVISQGPAPTCPGTVVMLSHAPGRSTPMNIAATASHPQAPPERRVWQAGIITCGSPSTLHAPLAPAPQRISQHACQQSIQHLNQHPTGTTGHRQAM